jgi:hypothetical protein
MDLEFSFSFAYITRRRDIPQNKNFHSTAVRSSNRDSRVFQIAIRSANETELEHEASIANSKKIMAVRISAAEGIGLT